MLAAIGYLIYSHIKAGSVRLQPESISDVSHARNTSDASIDESNGLVRAPHFLRRADGAHAERDDSSPNDRIKLTKDDLQRILPATNFSDSLSEFHERVCTICLGE